MAYKDFDINDKMFVFSMDKFGEQIKNMLLRNGVNECYLRNVSLAAVFIWGIGVLQAYVDGKQNYEQFELPDSGVELLKFATLSLKRQDLENIVSNFLRCPSLETAQKALQAYNNLAEHSVAEILKDEAKQEINKIC